MISKEQVKLAETIWQQAREAALHADSSWRLVIQSMKTLRQSYISQGSTFSEATAKFENLLEQHAAQYKSALEHMDKMSKEYNEILQEFKKSCT